MTSHIIEEWLMKWNLKLEKKNRNVVLFVDNCSTHPKVLGTKLKNVRLEFFPPNLTFILQQIDNGIIRSFNVHYRKELISEMVVRIENKLQPTKIIVFDCIMKISHIWSTY